MAWFNWLQRLLTPSRPRHRRGARQENHPRRIAPAPVRPPLPSTPTPSVSPDTGVPTPPAPTAPQSLSRPATLVVRVVTDHNRPLQPALVLTGRVGDDVHLRVPQIAGYVLHHLTGYTQNFISEYGLMTLVYDRLWGQPVIAYLVDYDTGRLLMPPAMKRGRLGDTFHFIPPTLPNYRIFQAQGEPNGSYTTTAQRLVYYYRRQAWQTVQRVHQYVTLLSDHFVYDDPAGKVYGYQFPAKSLWRIFSMITLENGEIWYNLGGAQWLDARDTQRHAHWSRQLKLPPKISQWITTAVNLSGIVDYVPHDQVTIFREPYGEIAGQLKDGEPLAILKRLNDDQGLTWYQVGPQAYINGRYVRLTSPV